MPAVSIDRNYMNIRDINHIMLSDEIGTTKTDANSNISTNLLGKSNVTTSTADTWRWCTFICAAIKCFGNNNFNNPSSTTSTNRNGCYLTIKPRRSHQDNNLNITYEL